MKVFFTMGILTALFSFFAGCDSPKCEPESNGYRREYYDRNAPKTIRSKDITKFTCDFNASNISGYEDYEYCGFSMTRGENGVTCRVFITYGGHKRFDISFETSFDAFVSLQKILDETNVAKCHGWYRNAEALSL